MKTLALVLVLGGLGGLLATCNSPVVSEDGVLLQGMWSSDQGRLTANQSTVTWSGACGSGGTSLPIMLDKHGRFSLEGTYTPAGGAAEAAQYQGTPSKGRMSLMVTLPGSSRQVGPLLLDLNGQTPLGTCK